MSAITCSLIEDIQILSPIKKSKLATLPKSLHKYYMHIRQVILQYEYMAPIREESQANQKSSLEGASLHGEAPVLP